MPIELRHVWEDWDPKTELVRPDKPWRVDLRKVRIFKCCHCEEGRKVDTYIAAYDEESARRHVASTENTHFLCEMQHTDLYETFSIASLGGASTDIEPTESFVYVGTVGAAMEIAMCTGVRAARPDERFTPEGDLAFLPCFF